MNYGDDDEGLAYTNVYASAERFSLDAAGKILVFFFLPSSFFLLCSESGHLLCRCDVTFGWKLKTAAKKWISGIIRRNVFTRGVGFGEIYGGVDVC